MSANEARRDLSEKIRLELQLASEIRSIHRQIVRQTIKEYSATGRPFDAKNLSDELTSTLKDHYDHVGMSFDNQITDILPSDIEATEEERAAITAALTTFFALRALEQSEIITATNQKDIDDSIDQSIMMSQEAEEPQTRIDLAFVAGAILSRKLNGRVSGIATLETQSVAEAAKATEAQILTFQPPSVTGGTPREAPVTKEWVTVGDERVRTAHIGADSQVQTLNQPFVVGGQLLRWPGDTSLGATPGNVINCRCSSVVNAQNVFAIRRQRGELPMIDQTASEQLLTSLG